MNIKPLLLFLFIVLVGLIVYKGFDKTFSKEGYKYSAINSKGKLQVVVIDAGHGGFDNGCQGKVSYEKNVNLELAKLLKKKITEEYPDVKIIMTRDKDIFIPLDERALIANKAKADLFIALHCNYYTKDDVVGTETFVRRSPASPKYSSTEETYATIKREMNYENEFKKFNTETIREVTSNLEQNIQHSLLFANMVEKNFINKSRRISRGVKHANFYVLRNTWMPSVLIEAGFLSNDGEEKYLSSDYGKNSLVESIMTAFGDYKKQLESDKAIEMQEAIKGNASEEMVAKTLELETEKIEKEEKIDKSIKDDIAKEVIIDVHPDEKPSPTSTKVDDQKLLFKVQLCALSKQPEKDKGMWAKVPGLTEEQSGTVYKYFTKGVLTYAESIQLKDEMKSVGFSSAFVVAYKGSQKIDLATALKLSK